MKTTIQSCDSYQIIRSEQKEKPIILQSKINNNERNDKGTT